MHGCALRSIMSGAIVKELTQLIGSRVILEVAGNTTLTGILYSVDADSGLVALRDNAMGHQADYNIVNAAHIVKFSSVGAPLSADKVEVLSSKVPAVPEETLQKYYARESQQVCYQLQASALSQHRTVPSFTSHCLACSGQEGIRARSKVHWGRRFKGSAAALQFDVKGPSLFVGAPHHRRRHSRIRRRSSHHPSVQVGHLQWQGALATLSARV